VARAFDRFTRADDGRGDDGTGLGLAIVRAIARAHGGDAHIASGPEGGADVWLAIPATRDPVERSRSGPVQADPAMIAPCR
jgi:two-component system, OmpR family, sensor kinase